MGKWIVIYGCIVNIISFLVYGLDKWKAKRDSWRIPERTLLLLAAIGGSFGALAGMQFFRHKTKHMKFVIGVPGILILQIALLWLVCTK